MALAEWILGDDAAGEHYLVHTKPPRFVGRLAEEDTETIDGITFSLSSRETLCDIQWHDPAPEDLVGLLRAIEAGLDEHDNATREILDAQDLD